MEGHKINIQRNQHIADAEIVRKVLAGEKEWYELLMRRNNQKLFRVIRGYINDEAEIADIMQNTYLKAFEKLEQFNHHSLFSTWLIRIGINEALKRLNKKGRIVQLHNKDNKTNISYHLISDDTNPEKIMLKQEARLLLEQAIDRLDQKYRLVYILKEIESMSIAEISEGLGITESNVKVRLHRARAKMKDELFELSRNYEVFEFGFAKCDRLVQMVLAVL